MCTDDGIPFWVSVSDANGVRWTNGPLHPTGGKSTKCLDWRLLSASNRKLPSLFQSPHLYPPARPSGLLSAPRLRVPSSAS
ncbi:hypothetical protein BD414DRAFT_491459 [Trametes punicea]|nr:hypothetical protein BD414DRAFT_491459 [Trametes punicea]